ncbi:MAG: asparagine--tRNA ligase [Deltaproteobacteria bacterium]|nr:asparagine--tRNA ligase [Deltaproteobacteria bacterium]
MASDTPPVVSISRLAHHVGSEVVLQGWLYNKRSSGKLHFLEVRDGSGITQCVMAKAEVGDEAFAAADGLQQESSLRVTGKVVAHPKREGVYELLVTGTALVAAPTEAYPITKKEHGPDFLMDHRHLWLRSKRQHAIMRVRHTIVSAIREFFDSRDFTLIDAPIFTPSACEGTSTLFETDYHGQPAYLTQSGQLYMEAAAAAFGKVYCFGPTFRAEKSKTRRHLAEFWMVEPEIAFTDLEGVMDLAEDFICHIVARVLEKRRPELAELERDVAALEKIQKPFPRLTYTEAVKLVAEERAKLETPSEAPPLEWGNDFGGEDETLLAKRFDRPVMVHRWPEEVKAFYMKRDPNDARLALGVDVIAPEGYGEIIGGGQREESLDVLDAAIRKHGLPMEAFEWYRDIRKYGGFPHGGFGLGLERMVSWMCGLGHVRETIPFPRMLNRLSP